MALFHNVTRGGQVHIHQIRMIRQVLWFALIVATCCGAGYFGTKTYRMVPSWAWQTLWEYHVAELNVVTQPEEKKSRVRQRYYPPLGRPYERTSMSILQDKTIRKTVFEIETYLTHLFWKSVKIGGWSFLLALVGWTGMGWMHRRKKQHRGNALVSDRSLARKLRWTFKASDLRLGKLPLVKNSETSHILISGTTGAGKSNTFHTLLPRIRKRGNKAIIVDIEGEMVSRYYREGQDILLNPFDARALYWDLWQELESEPLYKVFASAVVPPLKNVKDPLWENAARKVLMAALKKFKETGETSPQKLYDLLVYFDPESFEAFFRRTEAATFTQEKGEKFTLSIRASLEQHLEFFKYLPEHRGEKPFSIRKWIQSETHDQWLFISCKEDWRLSLMPLISGWTDIAMSALMSLPKDRKRRLWIVLDELPALNALPCLMSSLSRTRKYGGCVMAGVQNFKQLDLTYGRTESEVLIDLFNTKVFFRNSEQGTAEWVARALGETEETEVIENLSYGANTMRDGVSLNQQTKRTPLVIPTEVTMLKDFEAFVKLPGHYPVTQVKIPLVKGREIAREFIPRIVEDEVKSQELTEKIQKKLLKEESFPEVLEGFLQEVPISDFSDALEGTVEASLAGDPVPSMSEKESSLYDSMNVFPVPLSDNLEQIEKNLDGLDEAIKTQYMSVLSLLLKEAQRGRIYTSSVFSSRFEGLGGLGSASSISSILNALSAKNIIGYFMNGQDYGFSSCKAGYVWVPGMKILRPGVLDKDGLEIYAEPVPTHAKDPANGVLKEVVQ